MPIQKPGAPGSTPTPQDGLPGAIGESKSSTVAGYSIERTIQGTQALESLESRQKDVRTGGTGPFVSVNGVGLQNIPFNSDTSVFGTATGVSERYDNSFIYYSGSGITPTIALTGSNISSVISVISVTGSATFPLASGVEAGYLVVGNGIAFQSSGTQTFDDAAVDNRIPASGDAFYVNYTYNTITTTSVVFSGSNSSSNTMLDNQLKPLAYIPNVGNRFSR